MRRPTIIILVLIAAVLIPMWVIAAQGPPSGERVELDSEKVGIKPTEEFVDTPNTLSPSQVGVIVWVALFALLGILVAVHRFMASIVRPEHADGAGPPASTDGGRPKPNTAGWLSTDDRWVVTYKPAAESLTGLVSMAVLTGFVLLFAVLFTREYVTVARTQYFGVYAAGMFFSLAGLTVAYYAWFLPHVEVAERRKHYND